MKGTIRAFNETINNLGKKGFNLATPNDYKIMLLSDMPSVGDTTPDSSDYTEISGGGYTQGGIQLDTTWLENAGVNSFKSATTPTWLQDATGSETIRAGLIYSVSESSENAVCFIDMTNDNGVTPISQKAGDIAIVFSPDGLFDIARGV